VSPRRASILLLAAIAAACGDGGSRSTADTPVVHVEEPAPVQATEPAAPPCTAEGAEACAARVREGDREALTQLAEACLPAEGDRDATFCDALVALHLDESLVWPRDSQPEAPSTEVSLAIEEADGHPRVVATGFPALRGDLGDLVEYREASTMGRAALRRYEPSEGGDLFERDEDPWMLLHPHDRANYQPATRTRVDDAVRATVETGNARLLEAGYRPLVPVGSPAPASRDDLVESPWVIVWSRDGDEVRWFVRGDELGPIVRWGTLPALIHTEDETTDGEPYACDWAVARMTAELEPTSTAIVLRARREPTEDSPGYAWCRYSSITTRTLVRP